MYIAGISMGETQDGQNLLNDGGACLLGDGKVLVAIAEERISRKTHIGGFAEALQYCLDTAGIDLDEVDRVVVSSCSEEILPNRFNPGLAIADQSKIVVMPSHHLSHAYSAFMPSPFEQAIIMVLDNEGNITGPRLHADFWRNTLERNSYYVGQGNRILPLPEADDRLNGDEIGPGEAYRYFTHFLGWHSYVYAGKTMGLAPYGREEFFSDVKLFELRKGEMKCLLPNVHNNPIQAILQFGEITGHKFGPPRHPNAEITQRHRDIAFLIQDRLEKAIVEKVKYLHQLTGLKNLCIAGGVGLNCVANRRILDETPIENIFIQPASGDSGQCLGNVLYGHIHLSGGSREQSMSHVYFGKRYSDRQVNSALQKWEKKIVFHRPQDIAAEVANLLAGGNVIGWFQGESEFGPRALGHRSIFADPRLPAMQDFLNLVIKRREAFRPYAPSVLLEEVNEFFDIPCTSPFMLLAAPIRPEKQKMIPAVTHVDGTSRIQTVARQDNALLHALLSQFKELTGIPLILNTSFNLANEPIVETPEDALDCFMRTQLDYLVLQDWLVQKKMRRASQSLRGG